MYNVSHCISNVLYAMSRTNIRILKINSNFIEIRVSEASAVRHGPNFLGRIWTFVFEAAMCVVY